MRRTTSDAKRLTDIELQIVTVIWEYPEDSSVEEICSILDAAGRSLVLPGMRTMSGILQDKGYLSRRPEGKRLRYRAEISRPTVQRSLEQGNWPSITRLIRCWKKW